MHTSFHVSEVSLTKSGRDTFFDDAKINPPRFPNLPAGIGGSFVSPLCDAMVPHSLHFPALLGLCPRCLGSHHSAWYVAQGGK